MEENSIANLNELFDKRHDLKTYTVGTSEHPVSAVFAEVVNGESRRLENISEKAQDFVDKFAPYPRRAKGKTCFASVADFTNSIEQVFKLGDFCPLIKINSDPQSNKKSTLATVEYNATTFDGGVGYSDWIGELQSQPNPEALRWLVASNMSIPFTEFAKLVYLAGDAIVDFASIPEKVKRLAARLKLDLATSLADLIALENGFEGTGDYEESTTQNPHTGDFKKTVSRKGKPQVPVPTGFVINYNPFGWARPEEAKYAKAILFKLSYTIIDSVAVFTVFPVNLETSMAEIATHLQDDLTEQFEGNRGRIFKVI